MLHHGLDTVKAADHLGFVVSFELHSGGIIEGRVEAVDHENVYLLRTRHGTVALSDIKRIVNSTKPA